MPSKDRDDLKRDERLKTKAEGTETGCHEKVGRIAFGFSAKQC